MDDPSALEVSSLDNITQDQPDDLQGNGSGNGNLLQEADGSAATGEYTDTGGKFT